MTETVLTLLTGGFGGSLLTLGVNSLLSGEILP